MMTATTAIQIHPCWMILFLMAYVAAFYVFDKTDGNIIAAALTLVGWNLTSVAIVYYYYGLL
tara:strand:- start:288 stop:473 length:186 start_codon:yes stop_codon:yes gene_type:complete